MQTITRNMIVSAPKGGELNVISEDGEVVTTFAVQPGRHRASHWSDLLGPGETLSPGVGVSCFSGRAGVTIQAPQNLYASDANPDFQPLGQAEKLANELRRQLGVLSANNKANAARAAMQKRVEVIPQAPAPASKDGETVVE